ncbi:MAG: HPr family phosphocarrier protein [Acidobacteria bacterium]|jgi:phosphocarrier protein HPr|nr:HPr family phosphocarrier protein [Acidobacteriota bacterium]
MQRRSLVVSNTLGLHARAAAKFARLAGRFVASVKISRDGRQVDGKSILGLLVISAACGATLEVTADGPDELEAIAALSGLVERGFDDGEE